MFVFNVYVVYDFTYVYMHTVCLEIMKQSLIGHFCSERLFGYTGSWSSICVIKCMYMYVGQLFFKCCEQATWRARTGFTQYNILCIRNLTYNAKCASCEFAVCGFVCKSIAMQSQ